MPSRAGRMAAQDLVVTVFGATGFFGRYVVDALGPRAAAPLQRTASPRPARYPPN